MTKSTYRTKDLTRGLLMALEGESLIIMVRSMVAGVQGAGAGAESSRLTCKLEAEIARPGLAFENSKAHP